MSKKASEDALGDLHGALAEVFLHKLRSGEVTAADLSVIRQFLKDNGITADPNTSEPLKNIVDEIPDFVGENTFSPYQQ